VRLFLVIKNYNHFINLNLGYELKISFPLCEVFLKSSYIKLRKKYYFKYFALTALWWEILTVLSNKLEKKNEYKKINKIF
jgi:hypothetical protein